MADHLESTESEQPNTVQTAADEFYAPPPPLEEEDEPQGSKIVATTRKVPLHQVLGAGKTAEVVLWRNKKASAAVVGGATAIWAFFEVLEYHLLPFLCYTFIFALALLFLWSKTHIFIYKTPPHLPELRIEEEPFQQIASTARMEINRAIATLRAIASGRDLKKFLAVVVGLWVLSVLGSWYNFLTLFYIVVVLLHTVPVMYDKYEDKIDTYAEKIAVETKKKYAVINEKVVSKIQKGPSEEKRKKKE